MGLSTCRDCGYSVSDSAAACPACGCPTVVALQSKLTNARFGVIRGLIGVLGGLSVLAVLYGFPVGSVIFLGFLILVIAVATINATFQTGRAGPLPPKPKPIDVPAPALRAIGIGFILLIGPLIITTVIIAEFEQSYSGWERQRAAGLRTLTGQMPLETVVTIWSYGISIALATIICARRWIWRSIQCCFGIGVDCWRARGMLGPFITDTVWKTVGGPDNVLLYRFVWCLIIGGVILITSLPILWLCGF